MPNPTMPCPTWRPAEVRQSCVPYVVLPKGSAGEFIQFLKNAFGAIEKLKAPREDGTVMHCEMLLDDTSFMLADATADMAVYPFRHYIYVPDVDAVYTHALTCGGVSETIPADQPYGDRIAGIKDKWGNLWWIGTHMAQPG